MPQLARVFLQMRADDADAFGCAIGGGEMHFAIKAQRQIVLADLIALGQIVIKLILAIPFAELGDRAVDRQADHHRHLDRSFVHHRQRPRKRRHYGIDQRVGRGVVMIRMREVRRSAEHLRPRRQLDMNLHRNLEARGGDSSHGYIVHSAGLRRRRQSAEVRTDPASEVASINGSI